MKKGYDDLSDDNIEEDIIQGSLIFNH